MLSGGYKVEFKCPLDRKTCNGCEFWVFGNCTLVDLKKKEDAWDVE